MTATKMIRRISPRIFTLLVLATSVSPANAQPYDSTFDEDFADVEVPLTPIDPEDNTVDMANLSPTTSEKGQVIQNLGGGVASYYGRRFHGRLTANGETFDMNAFTAAHRSLPFGSIVRVTNPKNSRSVIVRINDRGPFVAGRVIDLSRAAAEELGLIRRGHAEVELVLIAS